MKTYNAKPLPKDATHLWDNYRQGYYVETKYSWYVVWQTDDVDVATIVSQCFGREYDYNLGRDLTLVETLEHCKNMRHEFSKQTRAEPYDNLRFADERFLMVSAEHYADRCLKAIKEAAAGRLERGNV